jgi:hypothetical protein
MGWRFRKSFSPLPGVRLNFSPLGISTSVGAGPFRFYVGSQGAAVTTRIPGTGISYRQPLHAPRSPQINPTPHIPHHHVPEAQMPVTHVDAGEEIHSASTTREEIYLLRCLSMSKKWSRNISPRDAGAGEFFLIELP